MASDSPKFRTIVADPPWPYNSGGPPNRQATKTLMGRISSATRYGSMSIEAICALCPPHEKNAHLYLWTTNSFLLEAFAVAKAWGFKQKTVLTWVKLRKGGYLQASRGTGHYFRGATEHVLFCTSGSLLTSQHPPRSNVLFTTRLPHSQKPEQFYLLVEEQSPGPYLELFARQRRSGWASWGNETGFDLPLAGEQTLARHRSRVERAFYKGFFE